MLWICPHESPGEDHYENRNKKKGTCICKHFIFRSECFKVNGYSLMGSNFTTLFIASLLRNGPLLTLEKKTACISKHFIFRSECFRVNVYTFMGSNFTYS